jgi:hypothetical protein
VKKKKEPEKPTIALDPRKLMADVNFILLGAGTDAGKLKQITELLKPGREDANFLVVGQVYSGTADYVVTAIDAKGRAVMHVYNGIGRQTRIKPAEFLKHYHARLLAVKT